MSFNIAEIVQLVVTVVFLAIFTYQVLIGAELNALVKEYLVVLIAFWFGLDSLGRVASRAIERKRTNGTANSGVKRDDFTA